MPSENIISVFRSSSSVFRVRSRKLKRLRNRASGNDDFLVQGEVKVGLLAPFSIDGVEFVIEAATWILGDFEIGSHATVWGSARADGLKYAKKIVVGKP
ncbi:MAG: hypothetical protein KDD53_12470 [Bdellovibrionales bacterium]|nr:hypothetical protein [Bdellovibrionales bacterium]